MDPLSDLPPLCVLSLPKTAKGLLERGILQMLAGPMTLDEIAVNLEIEYPALHVQMVKIARAVGIKKKTSGETWRSALVQKALEFGAVKEIHPMAPHGRRGLVTLNGKIDDVERFVRACCEGINSPGIGQLFNAHSQTVRQYAARLASRLGLRPASWPAFCKYCNNTPPEEVLRAVASYRDPDGPVLLHIGGSARACVSMINGGTTQMPQTAADRDLMVGQLNTAIAGTQEMSLAR